ncbi:hypothetical protein ACQZ4Y_19795 [Rhizobium sp. L80/93]|uniref:hypothetical protein n=1 Tax=Rhizobium sp. E27B/91 TaxID=2819995 RepID=UPI001ADA791F|nr:hypothetical protein [Rhizobium sp. E27B/91]MBO9188092.1 hypothetical protein [Rhizobium sp. E27B/91]
MANKFRWSKDNGATWNYVESMLPYELAGVLASDTVIVEPIGVAVSNAGTIDKTFRFAYKVPITLGSSSGFATHQIRWGEDYRGPLVIRLAANAPGNVTLGLKTADQNNTIDTGGLGGTVVTLTPGTEYAVSGDAATVTSILARSPDSAVPAGLFIDVEATSPVAVTPYVAGVLRAITPKSQYRHTVANQVFSTQSPPICLLADGTFFGGFGSQTLWQSTDFADNIASPTRTNLFTFTRANTTITTILPLDSGEILVIIKDSIYSYIYRSSGFATNRLTATWTLVLSPAGQGGIADNYSAHQWAQANGKVILAESGAQTSGGSDIVATDDTRAVRIYVSLDDGQTFTTKDIRTIAAGYGVPYPAGVHCHGVAYDKVWDRFYWLYGDGTGDGKNIAGYGYSQVLYSDDNGTTWNKLPSFTHWMQTSSSDLSQTGQFISVAFTDDVIVFTPDVTRPIAEFIVRRAGYRQYGAANLQMGDVPGITGRTTRGPNGKLFTCGGYNSGNNVAAGTYETAFNASPDGFKWDKVTLSQILTASGPQGITRVLGPTASGKIVAVFLASTAQMGGGNVMVADLVYAAPT